MAKGVEPDECYYIQNEAKVRNKDKLDLTIDLPPDLVLEVGVANRTQINLYEKARCARTLAL